MVNLENILSTFKEIAEVNPTDILFPGIAYTECRRILSMMAGVKEPTMLELIPNYDQLDHRSLPGYKINNPQFQCYAAEFYTDLTGRQDKHVLFTLNPNGEEGLFNGYIIVGPENIFYILSAPNRNAPSETQVRITGITEREYFDRLAPETYQLWMGEYIHMSTILGLDEYQRSTGQTFHSEDIKIFGDLKLNIQGILSLVQVINHKY